MIQQLLEAQATCHAQASSNNNATLYAMANTITEAVLLVLVQPISTTEEISQFGATCLSVITDCLDTIFEETSSLSSSSTAAAATTKRKYNNATDHTLQLMDANIAAQASEEERTRVLANMITEAVLMMLVQVESGSEGIEFCSQALQMIQYFILAKIPPPIPSERSLLMSKEPSSRRRGSSGLAFGGSSKRSLGRGSASSASGGGANDDESNTTSEGAPLRMSMNGGSPSADFAAMASSRKRESVGVTVNESFSKRYLNYHAQQDDIDDDKEDYLYSEKEASSSAPLPKIGLGFTSNTQAVSLQPPSRGTKRDSVEIINHQSETNDHRPSSGRQRRQLPSISEQYDVDIIKPPTGGRRISEGICPTAGLQAMDRLQKSRGSGEEEDGSRSLAPPSRRRISTGVAAAPAPPPTILVPPQRAATRVSSQMNNSLGSPTRRKLSTAAAVLGKVSATSASTDVGTKLDQEEYGWAVESNHPMYISVAAMIGVKLANCEWGSNPPIYNSVAKSMKIALPSMNTWNVETSSVYPSVQIIMNVKYDSESTRKVDNAAMRSSSYGWASTNNHPLYQSVANVMGLELRNCDWGARSGSTDKAVYASVAKSMDINLPESKYELDKAAVYPSIAVLMGWMGPTEFVYPRLPIPRDSSTAVADSDKPIYEAVGRLMGVRFHREGLPAIEDEAVPATAADQTATKPKRGRDENAWAYASSHPTYQSVANAMGMRLSNCDWGAANRSVYPSVAAAMKITLPNSEWNIDQSPLYPSVAIVLGLKLGAADDECKVFVSNWPSDPVVDFGWASSKNHPMYQSVANAMNMSLSNCDWGAPDPSVYPSVARAMNITMARNSQYEVEVSALYPSVKIMMRLDSEGDSSVSLKGFAASSSTATFEATACWTLDEQVDYGWAVASNHPMYSSVASLMGVKLANCNWGADTPIYGAVAKTMRIRLPSSQFRVEESSVYPSVKILMNISYDPTASKDADEPSVNGFGWASTNNHPLYMSVAQSMGMKLYKSNWGGIGKLPLYTNVAKSMGIDFAGTEFEVESGTVYPSTAILMGWMGPTEATYAREPVPKSSWVFGEKSTYDSVARLMRIRYESDGDIEFEGDVSLSVVPSPDEVASISKVPFKDAWAYASSHPVYISVANTMGMRLCDWGAADPSMYAGVAELMNVKLPNSHWNVESSSVYPSVAILLGLKLGPAKESETFLSSWPADKAVDYGWASEKNHPLYQSVANVMGMKLCYWTAPDMPMYRSVADLMSIAIPNSHSKVEKAALYPSVKVLMRLNSDEGDTYQTKEEPDGELNETGSVPNVSVDFGWAVASHHSMYSSVAAAMGVKLANCEWGADVPLYTSVAKSMMITLPSSRWRIEEIPAYPSVQIMMNLRFSAASTKESTKSFGWASANSHGLYVSVAESMGMKLKNTDWDNSNQPLYASVAKAMGIRLCGSQFEVETAAVYPSTAVLLGWMSPSESKYPCELLVNPEALAHE